MTAEPIGFWRSMLTARDNRSADVVKVLTAFVILVISIIEIFNVLIRGGAFEIASYAAASGGLIATLAAGVKIKSGTEPGDEKK